MKGRKGRLGPGAGKGTGKELKEKKMENQQSEKETLDALLDRAEAAPAQAGLERDGAPAFEEIGTVGTGVVNDWRRPRADMLRGVHLKVRVQLGSVQLPLKEALQLGPGSVVDLDKLADDPVEIYVHDLLVARGEVLVVNECFCVRVTEVFTHGGEDEEE